MNILITAATTAPAYKLKNKLTSEGVIMGDHLDLPDFMLKPGKFIRLPDPASLSYTHEMLTLCLDLDVKVIYLFRTAEIKLLKQSEVLFNEYQIKIAMGADEL